MYKLDKGAPLPYNPSCWPSANNQILRNYYHGRGQTPGWGQIP